MLQWYQDGSNANLDKSSLFDAILGKELEDDGQVRAWLNTAVSHLLNEPDWVVEYQV